MRYHAKGITLIEVLGGLTLLATLVVALVAIEARYTRQWAESGRRLDAVKAADALLTDWWKRLDDFPRDESGDVPGTAHLRWRTIVVDKEVIPELACQKVRLEIVDRNVADRALVAVELLLPPPEPPSDSPDSPPDSPPESTLGSRPAPGSPESPASPAGFGEAAAIVEHTHTSWPSSGGRS